MISSSLVPVIGMGRVCGTSASSAGSFSSRGRTSALRPSPLKNTRDAVSNPRLAWRETTVTSPVVPRCTALGRTYVISGWGV